ncbi:undecaprenyl-diphosphate phosphatase [Micrococcales bacterium 31B]|nr:undecaprenyl-diphosphate phosphatase [Micrococcales bacterium 31B]
MNIFESAILGFVQGLTEFLPVSSSAHLSIIGQLMGKDPGSAFTAICQLGTELAVLIYFWKDIVRIVKAWFGSFSGRVPRDHIDVRMGWLVIIGSLPIAVLGLLFQDAIDTSLRSLYITATMLVVFGIVLAIADRYGASREQRGLGKSIEDLTWRDGILYGFAQALALIPGVSRSGGTISGGLFLGYKREAAARYSFLLAIPAVIMSGLYKVAKEAGNAAEQGVQWPGLILATIIAFVVGYAVIAWFMKYISTKSFMPFVIYRIAVGIIVFVLLGTGVLQA